MHGIVVATRQAASPAQAVLVQSCYHCLCPWQAHLSNLGPRSLAHDRPTEAPRPGTEESWFTRMLLTVGGYYSRESRLIRGAKVLYADVVEQATNRELYKGAGC